MVVAADLELWRKVAAAIGGSVEEVAAMQEEERQQLVEVLGLVPAAVADLELWKKVALAIGGSVEDVAGMPEKERQQLVEVLGLAPVKILDSDEEDLGDNHNNNDIHTYDISSEDEVLVVPQVQVRVRGQKKERQQLVEVLGLEEKSCKICVKEHDGECPVRPEEIQTCITNKTSDITLQDMPTLKPTEATEESSTRSICHTKSSSNVFSSPNKNIKLKPYPERPKKPINSYVVFQSKHRPNVEHEMPGSPKKLVEKELAKRWGKLKPDEKAPYEKESNENKERFYNEMKAYLPELEKARALEAMARDKEEFQLKDEGNTDKANVKDPFCTKVKEFFETTDLQMIPAMPPTLADGNCFFDSMASQVKLHQIPGVPQTHLGIRLAACDHLKHLPEETKEGIINLFNGNKKSIDSLACRQRKPHQFVDNKGIMVLATADFLCRNIHIYSYPGEGSKKTYGLSRVDPSAELRKQQANTKAPLTVFLDNEHYQSIQKIESY